MRRGATARITVAQIVSPMLAQEPFLLRDDRGLSKLPRKAYDADDRNMLNQKREKLYNFQEYR